MSLAERTRYSLGYAKSVLAGAAPRTAEMLAHDADVLAELEAIEPYLLAALAVAARHPGEMAAFIAEDDEPTATSVVGWA